MSLPVDMVKAIARAVEAQGGDMADVDDLVWTWERVHRRNRERADICRREARELATKVAPERTEADQ